MADPAETFPRAGPLVDRSTTESIMDKDRIQGIGRQIKGSIKEGIGRLTGDAKLQGEGAADKAAGKVQNAVGGLKDTVREEN
jgi:uncharacterized protein YjbJ (UPF0337 family)